MLVSRRSVVVGAGAGAALVGATPWAYSAIGVKGHAGHDRERKRLEKSIRRRRDRVLAGWSSPNGWPAEKVVNDHGSIWTCEIPGVKSSVDLRIGPSLAVISYVLKRFNSEVQELRNLEIVGFVPGWVPGDEGNHASGTAIDVLPGQMPRGTNGNLFPLQVEAIKDILNECDGTMFWGGASGMKSQGHFHVTSRPGDAKLLRVSKRLEALL